MGINQTERKDNLVLSLEAAIRTSNLPFYIYDASFFKGEGELDGDWLVIAENPESEYAIVIETIQATKSVPTIAGMRNVPNTEYKLYYPFYDEGDASVGMEDAWIIDFDDEQPDYYTDGMVDISLHTVTWFLTNEIRQQIDNALSAAEFQSNHFINPED